MAQAGSQKLRSSRARAPGDDNARMAADTARFVRAFGLVVLWPLQLVPTDGAPHVLRQDWDLLTAPEGGVSPRWTEIDAALPRDPSLLGEGTYREFEAFLPHVQRFLYARGQSPIRVFRRHDISQARIIVEKGAKPILLDVAHIDLHVFPDVNIVVLALELAGRDLRLECAQEIMYRLGRAYPAGWSEAGNASYCLERVEWLDATGRVLATSDYEQREKFAQSICDAGAPRVAAHWAYAMAPLVLDHGQVRGPLRYQPVASSRMPIMAYLALDNPRCLTPNDYVRLGLALVPGDPDASPYGPTFLKDFESRYCYDRFHDPTRADDWTDTRIMCCGHAFVTIGDARLALFTDPERGVLALFRRQFFLLGLLAHFHRATMLMLLDRFVRTINSLDIERPETIRRFRIELRHTIELFLSFSHRYWFFEISDQPVVRELFRMWSDHLNTGRLYTDVNDELQRMSQYLDSVMLRRTSGTVVRLTVVAILSLIGTATTGFLGMNLLDEAQAPFTRKVLYFSTIAALALALTIYTIMKSHRLAEFHDILADERLSWRVKLRAFLAVWAKRP
jgi:hypothetical protein